MHDGSLSTWEVEAGRSLWLLRGLHSEFQDIPSENRKNKQTRKEWSAIKTPWTSKVSSVMVVWKSHYIFPILYFARSCPTGLQTLESSVLLLGSSYLCPAWSLLVIILAEMAWVTPNILHCLLHASHAHRSLYRNSNIMFVLFTQIFVLISFFVNLTQTSQSPGKRES